MEKEKFTYWYFNNVIPLHVCNDIVKRGTQGTLKTALTGKFLDKKDLHEKRNSDIKWLNENWIYNHLIPYAHLANKNAEWNYQVDGPEHIQFTKYSAKQHYGWHQDAGLHSDANREHAIKHYNGKIRKLSMTCQLSDPKDYSGGEFEFDFRNYDPDKRRAKKREHLLTEISGKGSVLVFPSFLWHRVKPVTKGIRYSLVAWMLGNPWR